MLFGRTRVDTVHVEGLGTIMRTRRGSVAWAAYEEGEGGRTSCAGAFGDEGVKKNLRCWVSGVGTRPVAG